MNRARAKAILILHPPLKSLVAIFWRSGVKPRPLRIREARVSAVAASNSSKRS
jgi:hypothetical protein